MLHGIASPADLLTVGQATIVFHRDRTVGTGTGVLVPVPEQHIADVGVIAVDVGTAMGQCALKRLGVERRDVLCSLL